MTRDDIIRMARQVGYTLVEYEGEPYIPPLLAALLRAVAASERDIAEAQRGDLLEALKLLHDATWLVSKGHYNEELHDIAVSKARAVIKKMEAA